MDMYASRMGTPLHEITGCILSIAIFCAVKQLYMYA